MLFHEIAGITNLLNELTNANLMNHLDTCIQHELLGRKASNVNSNVSRLLDYVNERQNPFIVTASNVRLHNILTKQVVNDTVKERLLHVHENGENDKKRPKCV